MELSAADEYSSVVPKVEVDEDFNDLGISQPIKVEDDDEGYVKSDIAILQLEYIGVKEQKNENEEESLDEGHKQQFKAEYLPEYVKLEDGESEEECPRKKTKNINVELDLKAEALEQEDENEDNEDYEDNEGEVDDDDESSDKYGQKSSKYIRCDGTVSERQYKQDEAATDGHEYGSVDFISLCERKALVFSRCRCSSSSGTTYECSQCNYSPGYEGELKCLERHRQAKHGKKQFKCEACDFSTGYKHSLEKHVQAKHSKKKFKCEDCDFSTGHRLHFERHMHSKHSENEFKCEDCDFSTRYKGSLKVHMQVKHRQETTFKCEGCDYSTGYKSNLVRHIQLKNGGKKLNKYTVTL